MRPTRVLVVCSAMTRVSLISVLGKAVGDQPQHLGLAGRGARRAALGFAAGALVPGRFTAPLVTIAPFFVLALSTQLINGSQSYWQISPVVAAPWDIGPTSGRGGGRRAG